MAKLLSKALLIMPPTLKKYRMHIGFGLCVHLSVCPWVRSSHFLIHAISYELYMPGVRNFIYGFFMKTMADFFSCPSYQQDILKNI